MIYDDTTGLFAVKREMGKWALARPEYAEDFGPNAAVRCANCAAAHPGYSFRLFDPNCEKTVRPDFTEACAFPGQINANDLERFVYTLNGSTWPKVGVIGGRKYIMKRGLGKHRRHPEVAPEHIRNEIVADNFHRAAGLKAPACREYVVDGEVVKLAEYVEGGIGLREVWCSAGAALREKIREQVLAAYPAESFLANIDVFCNDNALVAKDGTVWYVDNGATFDYRAQGGLKGWFWKRNDVKDPTTGFMALYNHPCQSLLQSILGGTAEDEFRAAAAKYRFCELAAMLPKAYQTDILMDYAAQIDAWSGV